MTKQRTMILLTVMIICLSFALSSCNVNPPSYIETEKPADTGNTQDNKTPNPDDSSIPSNATPDNNQQETSSPGDETEDNRTFEPGTTDTPAGMSENPNTENNNTTPNIGGTKTPSNTPSSNVRTATKVPTKSPTKSPTKPPTKSPPVKTTTPVNNKPYTIGNYTGTIKVTAAQTTSTNKTEKDVTIDYGNANKGYVMVKANASATVRVLINAPNGKTYQSYYLTKKSTYYTLPLQGGSGQYTVTAYLSLGGNKYSTLNKVVFTANPAENYTLMPTYFSNYDSSSSAVRMGYNICMNESSDVDKVKAVYNYILDTISYDKAAMNTTTIQYIPDPDEILSTKKGICQDYASLMAAMLRPQGIKTRFVVGNANNGSGYTGAHAWNEVYIAEKGGWIAAGIFSNGTWKRLDATFGDGQTNGKVTENNSNYTVNYYY